MAIVKFDRGLFPNGNTAKGLSYGQIEPNQVWFDRAGMVEAQCKLDKNWFADSQVAPLTKAVKNTAPAGTPSNGTPIVAQVGAFLQVDKATYTVSVPTQDGKEAGMPVGINYSSEKLYNQFAPQRRNFFLTTEDWLPRIGYVERGMRITTNTVSWSDEATGAGASMNLNFSAYTGSDSSWGMYTQVKNFLNDNVGKNTPIYAAVIGGSDGELVILGNLTPGTPGAEGVDIADPSTYIVLAQVVAAYSNADRTCSFMFQILDGGTK